MFYKNARELTAQCARNLPVLTASFAIHVAIVFNTTVSWKVHTAQMYSAQMSVIDAVLFNCQKKFFGFLLPLLALETLFLLPYDPPAAIVLRGSRTKICLSLEIKSAFICLVFTVVHISLSLLSAGFYGIGVLINFDSPRSVYCSANGFTTDLFSFRMLFTTVVLYTFLTSFIFALIFQIFRAAAGPVSGIIATVAVGFNEAWFLPIFSRFSGLYHIQLNENFSTAACIGLPLTVCAALTAAGIKIFGKKELYG